MLSSCDYVGVHLNKTFINTYHIIMLLLSGIQELGKTTFRSKLKKIVGQGDKQKEKWANQLYLWVWEMMRRTRLRAYTPKNKIHAPTRPEK